MYQAQEIVKNHLASNGVKEAKKMAEVYVSEQPTTFLKLMATSGGDNQVDAIVRTAAKHEMRARA